MPKPARQNDTTHWAQLEAALRVDAIPDGAVSLNVNGRQVVGPLQGFGPLWQKTFRTSLGSRIATPEEVVRVWKEHLPDFQPRQNRFFPSVQGIVPGQIVLINAMLSGMPMKTGVLVLYADETAFTLMTPQGHMESGWVTFSAFSRDGATICQIQTLARTNDPIYELGFRMIGYKAQNNVWKYVLISLAAYFDVEAPVELHLECLDRRLQWRYASNVWQNATIRSMLYSFGAPVRWLRGKRSVQS